MEHQASTEQSVLRPGPRVVNVRDLRRGRRPYQVGVRRLPLSVIALSAEGGLNRIQGASGLGSLPTVEVPRILMQNRVRGHRRDYHVIQSGSIVRSKALPKTLRTLTKLVVAVHRLLNTRGNPHQTDGHRVQERRQAQMQFLLRG